MSDRIPTQINEGEDCAWSAGFGTRSAERLLWSTEESGGGFAPASTSVIVSAAA
jgi:hypothetical protein